MGWYLRKGFNFGPLRLNLSKSGLGYSFGVKGARIGVGPRGNYIHLGRGGVYYRQSLPRAGGSPNEFRSDPSVEPIAVGTPIPSTPVEALADSGGDQLLAEIRHKNSLARFAPVTTVVAGLIFFVFLFSDIPDYWKLLPIPLLIVGYWFLSQFDRARKLVILNYRLDADAEKAYSALLSGLRELRKSSRLWRVTTRDAVLDRKYQAGASELVSRKAISLSEQSPRFLQVNVPVAQLRLVDQQLVFLADRMLLYHGAEVAAIHYSEITVENTRRTFIETEGVPGDSQVVGHTWRYVNRNGGPDRRFSNNQQIPEVLYAEIQLRTTAGVHFVIQVSSVSHAAAFEQALVGYSKASLRPSNPVVHGDEPMSEADDSPTASFGATLGWLLTPVVSVILLCMLMVFPPSETNAVPSSKTVQPLPSITIPPQFQSNCPAFKVSKGKLGKPIPVSVSPKVSQLQLQSLVWNLRKGVSERKLPNIPPETLANLNWAGGTILVYRGERFLAESLASAPPKKKHHVAEYRWTRREDNSLTDSAVVIDANGQGTRLF